MYVPGRLEMIFLVLHEEGAINYQEKRDAERATPRNNNNNNNNGQPGGAKRKLELEDETPKRSAT
jgi:hypothetical protein